MRQGTVGDELYVIESGSVRIVKHLASGEDRILGSRGPGEILGEGVIAAPGAVRSAMIQAESEVTALALTRAQIAEVMAGAIRLRLRLIALAKERGMPVPELAATAA